MNLKNIAIGRKDLLYIVLTVVILAIVGILGYQQLNPAGGGTGVSVEVVQPVGSSFNQSTLDHLGDDKKAKNFNVPADLSTGVGTDTPFGQL